MSFKNQKEELLNKYSKEAKENVSVAIVEDEFRVYGSELAVLRIFCLHNYALGARISKENEQYYFACIHGYSD